MEKSRLIGITCAFIAAILVIMAGKSCTEDSIRKNARNKQSSTVSANMGDNIIFPDEDSSYREPVDIDETTEPVVTEYDVFGNPVIVTKPTDPPVTDPFGNIIESTTSEESEEPQFQIVTDVFGNVTATIPVTAPAEESDQEPTTTLSLLDQYKEDSKKPNKFSGYYHGEDDEDQDDENTYRPPATIPPDFVIIID